MDPYNSDNLGTLTRHELINLVLQMQTHVKTSRDYQTELHNRLQSCQRLVADQGTQLQETLRELERLRAEIAANRRTTDHIASIVRMRRDVLPPGSLPVMSDAHQETIRELTRVRQELAASKAASSILAQQLQHERRHGAPTEASTDQPTD